MSSESQQSEIIRAKVMEDRHGLYIRISHSKNEGDTVWSTDWRQPDDAELPRETLEAVADTLVGKEVEKPW